MARACSSSSGSAAGAATTGGEAKKAAEAGAAFESAITLAEAGKHDEAEAAFAKIAAEARRLRTRARSARPPSLPSAIRNGGDRGSTTDLADDDQLGRDVAGSRRRARRALLIDTAPTTRCGKRLEPLAGARPHFRHTARELLALAAWRAERRGRGAALVRR